MEDNTKLVKRKKHKRNTIETAVAEIILILLILSVIISAIVVIKAASIRTETTTETTTEATTETETSTEIVLETETETEIIELATQKEVETEIETETEPQLVSMGTFTVTAYCSCEKCCGEWANNRPDGKVYGASGEELIADYSIATDVGLIPYGETILINDQEYVAHDCGGAIKGNRIDIYMSTHEMALEWGVQNIEIFKVVER